jgi:hypothetical protein
MRSVIHPAGAALLLAACGTAAAPERSAEVPDPRKGEEVRQVCFTSQIRSWTPEGRRAVVVEKGRNDFYLLELVGPCQPQDAFTSIGLISRVGGGSCLSSGDRLVTDASYNDGFCSIRSIHRWNKDAKPADQPEG